MVVLLALIAATTLIAGCREVETSWRIKAKLTNELNMRTLAATNATLKVSFTGM